MTSRLANLGSDLVKVTGRAVPMYFGLELGDYISNVAHLEPLLHAGVDAVYMLAGLAIGKKYSRELGSIGFALGSGLEMFVEDLEELLKETVEHL